MNYTNRKQAQRFARIITEQIKNLREYGVNKELIRRWEQDLKNAENYIKGVSAGAVVK